MPIMVFLLFSCSSDDADKNRVQEPVAENILGKWYVKSVIENGEDLNYTHKCTEEKDYVLFESGYRFSRVYNSDCTYDEKKRDYVVNDYYNTITTSFLDPIITNQRTYKIVKLTEDELVLKTWPNEFLGQPETNTVFTYTRQ